MKVWIVIGDVDYGPCYHLSAWATEAEAYVEVQKWIKVGQWDHVLVEELEIGKPYGP